MSATVDFDDFLKQLKADLLAATTFKPHFLLVTCIDLRYPGLIHDHLDNAEGQWFRKRYDQVCLAGGGLAGVIDFPPMPKPDWASTFIDHVGISKSLHDIGAIVVLEHRTCGAYREFKLLTTTSTQEEETAAHDTQLCRLKAVIKAKFPGLLFYSFLLPKESDGPTGTKMAPTKLMLTPLAVGD
jgi:hypothetical protein